MSTTPHDLDALLAQAGWAKALAHSLVRDPGRAEDLVQRAWLAAMRRPPAEGTPPRRWLAAVMRNLVRGDAREVARREQRERAVARPERAGGADQVDDAAALQVRLIHAVRELPEPSRSTVWTRYFDGLSPREIAKRDGVPVHTVKTRLARGLDMLRKRFDREHGGDRSAWIAAFLPLAAPPSLTASTIGVILMGAKWKAAAVVAVVLCGAVTWMAVPSDEPASSHAVTAVSPEVAPDPEHGADRLSNVEIVPGHAARAPVAATTALPVEMERSDSESLLRGRVLDLERHPVPGLEVGTVKRTRTPTVLSAADGSFAINRGNVGVALEATGRGWTTVWADRLPRAGIDRHVTIIVARSGKLSGSVVDPLGRPLAGASVDVNIDDSAQRTLADVIDADPHQIGYSTVSDAEGRFDLGEVPLVDGTIRASLDGCDARAIPIPTRARDDIVIAFDAPAFDDIVVRGSVGSAPTMRISGAYVRVGDATQRTANDGTFSLLVRPSDFRAADPIELVAVSENQLPTRVAFASPGDLRHRAASETFDLVLGNDPLRISGRVVDTAGDPLPSARVRLDEEPFGTVTVKSTGKPPRMYQTVEAIARGEPNSGAEPGKDDDVFSIGGLQEGKYRLVVRSIDPPAVCVLEHVQAGTSDLVVVVDTGGPKLRVAGRVVDSAGKGIVGMSVNADLDVGADVGPLTSRSVSTDSTGAFELTRLRGRVAQVFADLGPRRIGVDVKPGDPLDDIRIVVPFERAIQVDFTSKPGFATDFLVRNARGTVGLSSSWTIAAQTVTTKSERLAASLPILDGRSDVVTVDEDELTLVLLRQGQEVARVPIVFAKEGVTIIRP